MKSVQYTSKVNPYPVCVNVCVFGRVLIGQVKAEARSNLRNFRSQAGIDAQEHLLAIEKQVCNSVEAFIADLCSRRGA